MIQAVVPTIPGREHLVNATVESLEQHGIEPIVVMDSPSCGEGWEFGLEKCNAKYVGLWSDDLTIHAWEFDPSWCLGGVLCPTILNPDGSLQGAGGMGLDLPEGAAAVNCIAPIAERHVLVGFRPWPHLNHYCDTWITQRAIWAGRGPVVTRSIELVHHRLAPWDPVEYAAWQSWLGRPVDPHQYREHTGGME